MLESIGHGIGTLRWHILTHAHQLVISSAWSGYAAIDDGAVSISNHATKSLCTVPNDRMKSCSRIEWDVKLQGNPISQKYNVIVNHNTSVKLAAINHLLNSLISADGKVAFGDKRNLNDSQWL